jgi:hypothetical protein
VLLLAEWSWSAPVPGSQFSEPAKAFKEYLAEMPPIKRIVYEQSHQGKFGPGFVLADGAIQPAGYFLRHLSNSPYTTNSFVCGLSTEHEWSYAMEWQNVVYGPRDAWTNKTSALDPGTFSDFHMAVRLGLPPVVPGTFRWASEAEFEFTSQVWGDMREDYTGRITRWDEKNRPVQVVYQSNRRASPAWLRCSVLYEYAAPEDVFPHRFVQDMELTGGRMSLSNRIHVLEVGPDENAAQGYRLTNLQPPDAKINEVTFVSNGVRYLVHPDKTMTLYRYAAVPSKPASHGTRYSILLFGLGSLLITAVFLLRQSRRGRNQALPGALRHDRD